MAGKDLPVFSIYVDTLKPCYIGNKMWAVERPTYLKLPTARIFLKQSMSTVIEIKNCPSPPPRLSFYSRKSFARDVIIGIARRSVCSVTAFLCMFLLKRTISLVVAQMHDSPGLVVSLLCLPLPLASAFRDAQRMCPDTNCHPSAVTKLSIVTLPLCFRFRTAIFPGVRCNVI